MPLAAPLLIAALVIVTITGMSAATLRWTQERSDKLHREIEADIRQTLRQHATRKRELAALEQPAPPATTGSAAKRDDDKARKAQIGSIRKRATGHRRERFVPPNFARLPIAAARGAFGFLR
jgi:hypothetical protein